MTTLSVLQLILAVKIIVLAGISVVTGVSLLLAQSASATTDLMTNTTVGEDRGGEEETVSTTTSTTPTNNVSNALLGSLFLVGKNIEFNVNPINETYSVISYLGSRIIMPPNAPGIVINATETGNVTSNIQPNGLSIEQGQGFIMSEDGAAAAEKEGENATFTYVMLTRANPDGTGAGTGVAFFNTNSTGQLAFLDNMVAIGQVEFSPEGSTVREWEWKGGTLPLESGAAPPITGNQTTFTAALGEEEQ
jgi:hypothetical protein